MNDNKFIPQGWECPKCGAVMSPTTSVCVNCNGQVQVTVSTATNISCLKARWNDEKTTEY